MDFEKDFFLFCYFFYCSRKLKGIGSAQTGARLKGCLGCVCGGVLRVFCGVFGQCLGAVCWEMFCWRCFGCREFCCEFALHCQ